MSLWNESAGAPVFAATTPPWHPLTLLAERIAPDHASALIPLAAGFLSALVLAGLLGSYGVQRSRVAAAALLFGAGVAFLSPGAALLILGIATAGSSFEWLARRPSRARWALAVAAVAIALLGASVRLLPWLLLLGVWPLAAPFRRDPARYRAGAGSALAIVAALLLTAPWWWPAATLVERGAVREAPTAVDHAPEYFTVSRHLVVPDRQRAEAARRAVLDSRNTAIVDHVPAKILRLAGGTLVLAESPREVALEPSEDGRTALGIGEGGWALLVTNEPWWPGWRVYWNGERLPPVIVNASFVGSFVPEGPGVLQLRYRPDSFDEGVRAGGLGLLLFIASLAWPWFLKIRERPRGGRPPIDFAGRIGAAVSRSRAALQRLLRPAAWLAFIAYGLFLLANSTAVAGGADSSGYLNYARLLLAPSRVVPMDLPRELRAPEEDLDLFLPLGFSPGPLPATMVPSYPAGVPLHLVVLTILFGESGPRLFSPLAAIAAVGLMYVAARDTGFGRAWSFWSAAVLALMATFVMHSVWVMSDVAATAWSLAAMIGALRSRKDPQWALLAGAAIGISVLVRPTQVLLLPAVVVAIGPSWRALLPLGLAAAPFAAAQMAIGHELWGGAFRTGYGEVSSLLSAGFFVERFRHYSLWLAALLSPLVFPFGLAGGAVRSIPYWRRAALVLWFAPLFLFYCFYLSYETWWYTRFLLPGLPGVILLAFLAARAVGERVAVRKRNFVLGALLVSVLGVEGWQTVEKGAWRIARSDEIYPRATAMAARTIGGPSIILGMQLSGAEYYDSHETMVRWDGISPDRFERLRAHAALAGRRWYALLMDFEVKEAFRRAPGNWVPVARIDRVTLYELRP